jgi:hypothetical protein
MKRFATLCAAAQGALVGVIALSAFLTLYFVASVVVGIGPLGEHVESAGMLAVLGLYALPATIAVGLGLGLLATRIRRARRAVLFAATFAAFPLVMITTFLGMQATVAHAMILAGTFTLLFAPLAAPGLVASALLLERWTRRVPAHAGN